jgi:hypothetical protein
MIEEGYILRSGWRLGILILDRILLILLGDEYSPGPGAEAGGGDIGFDNIHLLSDFWFVVIEFSIDSEGMLEGGIEIIVLVVLHVDVQDESQGLRAHSKFAED